MDEVLDRYADKMRVPEGDQRYLALIIHLSLGKAFKTFHAVGLLCREGFGPDALILVRSNINLLINVSYILFHQNPEDAAKYFWAFSYKERERYLKSAHGLPAVPSGPPMSIEEINQRADLWPKSIKDRASAGKVPQFHYIQGYALYSSLEHSDTSALLGYISEWNEDGPTIEGASERDVDLALTHNFQVIADLLNFLFQYLKVPADDFRQRIEESSRELYDNANPSIAGSGS